MLKDPYLKIDECLQKIELIYFTFITPFMMTQWPGKVQT